MRKYQQLGKMPKDVFNNYSEYGQVTRIYSLFITETLISYILMHRKNNVTF